MFSAGYTFFAPQLRVSNIFSLNEFIQIVSFTAFALQLSNDLPVIKSITVAIVVGIL